MGPLIGITTDADAKADRHHLARSFTRSVLTAGGVPVLLPCAAEATPDVLERYLDACDAFVLSSGDDPDTSRWGVPLHPSAKPIDPERQAFEWALLDALRTRPGRPVLGVCLGMQMMALHAGGAIDQYLPDTLPSAADHWGKKMHRVEGALGRGEVQSHHRQAISDPGSMLVVATAPDGVIEAVRADDRPFYVGVQWHPERTSDARLGLGVVRDLVAACVNAER